MLDFGNARSVMDLIREYYLQHKKESTTSLKELYYSNSRPPIDRWTVAKFEGGIPGWDEIRWEKRGSTEVDGIKIDKYLLHHSQFLELPLVHIHKNDAGAARIVFWQTENGKASEQDWPEIAKQVAAGYDVISIDPRGLGETRMRYKAVSPDDPTLAHLSFDQAYVNPLSSVLADYVYNSLLVGRPYMLQTIEDVEIARRFVKTNLNPEAEMSIVGTQAASTFAAATAETLDGIHLAQPNAPIVRWSEIVDQKRELWPIEYLLPGGAYIH
jgi:hypothetical protein